MVDNTVAFLIIARMPTYYYTSFQIHHMISYVQTSGISSTPQGSYNDVSIKVIIAIQYFLMPRTVTFLSSPWHTQLRTTSQICIFSVDYTHSRLIYSLHSPDHLKYVFPSLLSGNRLIVTLILTLNLINRDAIWQSGILNPLT